MSAPAAQILRQLELQEPAIRAAFLEWVAEIVGRARVGEIERLIVAGRVDQIAVALGLDAASMAGVVESVRSAVLAGGMFESQSIRNVRLGFDIRHPQAERWLANHSSRLVTEILTDQRELIRQAVTVGAEVGRGPRQTALELVGRVDRSTGRRSGGIIGLTEQQGGYVANARRELESLDRNYLTRSRRDRRFDSIVRRAIENDRPLSAADVDRIVGRYSDRLLQYRGEVIARTEALTGFAAGRDLAYAEAIADGRLQPQHVRKVWKTAQDSKVRDSHRALNNESIPITDAFTSPTGARMRYPGDTELGAGPGDTIQCRCTADYRVDFLAQELG